MAEYIVPSEYEGKMLAAEKLIRCKDCRYWQTGIAYTTTGRCTHEDLKGLICNKNYYCADAEEKK